MTIPAKPRYRSATTLVAIFAGMIWAWVTWSGIETAQRLSSFGVTDLSFIWRPVGIGLAGLLLTGGVVLWFESRRLPGAALATALISLLLASLIGWVGAVASLG